MNNDFCLNYLESFRGNKNNAPIVIFLHGRGANELDLFDLSPQINLKYRVLSPRGPIEMGENCYGWFHTEYLPSGPVYDPAEVENSRKILIKFINEVHTKYGVPLKRIFLFGFSQGAIMSFGIALKQPELLGGIACLNGRILNEHIPNGSGPAGLNRFSILLSHGTEDEILSIEYARSAKRTLSKFPVELTYREYPMGHDVTEMNFVDAKDWLLAKV